MAVPCLCLEQIVQVATPSHDAKAFETWGASEKRSAFLFSFVKTVKRHPSTTRELISLDCKLDDRSNYTSVWAKLLQDCFNEWEKKNMSAKAGPLATTYTPMTMAETMGEGGG